MPCREYQVYDQQYIKDRTIITESGCWEWQGAKNGAGYGSINPACGEYNPHRLAYTLFKGSIPFGLLVRHTCDNPPCCNPEHLIVGSHGDNTQDAIERGRHTHFDTSAAVAAKSIPQHIVEDVLKRVELGENKHEIAAIHKIHVTSVYNILKRQPPPVKEKPKAVTLRRLS